MTERGEQFREPAKTIPVLAETEVLVVGGGPSGLAAALGASRAGVDVMLVDKEGFFGGNITRAMVESFAWYRHEDTVEAGGIGEELEQRTRELGEPQNFLGGEGSLLDADLFKIISDEMVREASVTPLFHCRVVDSIVEDGKIVGVITESKSGRQVIFADRVIDATGDADVVARAGAPFTKPETEELLPVTVGFGMSGVDVDRFREYVDENPVYVADWASETTGKEDEVLSPFLPEILEKARENGDIPEDQTLSAFWHRLTGAGEATGLNMTRIHGVDPTDVWDLTRAEIEGRQQVMTAKKILKKYAPGFEDAKLRSIGPGVGPRESRILEGEYELTKDDVTSQAEFDDSVGIFPEFLDAYGWVFIPTTGRYFQIPYRALVPKKVDNLLVAGRSVSGDRLSHAATRQMMCCAVTGQGAGVAAATSVKEETTTQSVEIEGVQENLREQGVRIE